MKYQAVPVVMYHSVGEEDKRLRHVICPKELFEDHLRWLKKKSMQAISLQQLYDYRTNGNKIPSNSIVLTFDDGYLDNWVFAYPLLKKYGFKGTIFVNPEFVDLTEEFRPNLEDVYSAKCKEEELDYKGFLSWQEMRKMEESGVIDIQSHSMSHTWFYCSDEIVDFHRPDNDKYPWIFWNVRPDRKSQYLKENQEHFVPYGTPIYKYGRSLGIRRYFEDKDLNRYLADFVMKQGDDFFKKNGWKSILLSQVELYKSKNELMDRYETDEEIEERYRYELIESRKLLEDKLNKKVRFLCWAGGAFNKRALNIAKEAGYLSSTIFFNDMNRKNAFGEDPSEINRTGCVSVLYWNNRFITCTDLGSFVANLKFFYGNRKYLWVTRLYKLKYLLKFYIIGLFKKEEPQ